MKPTQTMHDLGQSIWLDNITRDQLKAADGGDADAELARFAAAKVDVAALAQQLQDEGAKSFVKSWNDLLGVNNSKSAVLKRAS